MESLTKQTRIRFANTRQENKDESISTRDNKIPPQKTQSFEEKKRSQSWIKRQFSSRQMSNWDPDFYPTAVAAAAYAIQSLQQSQTKYEKEKSLKKIKSKVEDSTNPLGPLKSALKSSDENSRRSSKDLNMKVPISMKIPTFKKRLSFADADKTISTPPEKPATDVQLERPSTFPDKHLNIKEEENPEPTVPKPYRPPTPLPMAQVQTVETKIHSATRAVAPEKAAADAWEKEQMTSIKERYEKLKATIEEWETIKKRKATQKNARIEAELDKRRMRAVQSYRSSITRIEGIAGGARTQAEENRRNEEYKVRQKANKIRLTGKFPATCFWL